MQLKENRDNPIVKFDHSPAAPPLRVLECPSSFLPSKSLRDTHNAAREIEIRPRECKVFARPHPGCDGKGKQALVFVPGNCCNELPGLRDIQNSEVAPGLPRQINVFRRVCQKQLPADSLRQCRGEDCMGVADSARGESSVKQFAIERLDFCCRKLPERARTEPWEDVHRIRRISASAPPMTLTATFA